MGKSVFLPNSPESVYTNTDSKATALGEIADTAPDSSPTPIPQLLSVPKQPGSAFPVGEEEKPEVVVKMERIANHLSTQPRTNAVTSGVDANTPMDALLVPTNSADPPSLEEANNQQAYHRLNLDQETGFWEKYVKQAEALDKKLVDTLSSDLETLLIFVSSVAVTSLHILIDSLEGWSLFCRQYRIHRRILQRSQA